MTFDFDQRKVLGTWVIECALLGCTLVPSMKSVGEIASEIGPVLWFITHLWENLTLTFDLDQPKVKVIVTWVIDCALLDCTLVQSMKSVGKIASEILPVLCLFYPFWGKFDLDHRHLGH